MKISNRGYFNNSSLKYSSIELLNSRPIIDLGLLLSMFPLWWVLGLESIILPIGCFLIFLKMFALHHGKINYPITIKWFSVFLIASIISGLFIIEDFRYITFFRNLSVYLTVFFILLIVVNSVRNWNDVKFIISVIILITGISAFFSLLAIINLWRPNFTSLIGNLLPQWIANTNYGNTIVLRKLGNIAYYQGFGYYFRVKGFFSYSILYASALAFTIPIAVYFHSISHNQFKKLLSKIIIALLLINLIFTTGRIAIFGLLIGLVYYIIFVSRRVRSYRVPILIIFSLIILLFLVISVVNFDALLSNEEFSDVAYLLFYGRGASTSQRIFVYQETVLGWLQRPIFGWGTERDIPDFKYPAGSHSFYLGLLYKNGFVGIFVFAMVIISLWKATAPYKNKIQGIPQFSNLNQLLRLGRWVIVIAIIDAITTDPTLDIVTMSILWLIFAILISTRKIMSTKWSKQLVLNSN